MLRIAIVEDEALWADKWKEYIHKFEQEYCRKFSILYFQDGGQIAENYDNDADVIFMDIEMNYMNGLEAAAEIRKKDEQTVIIFVTNMAQYALQGYKVNAMDYLLKPVSYVQFSQILQKAIQITERKQKEFLAINTGEGIFKVRISDILWMESHGHRITFQTLDGEYETTVYSLKELEEKVGTSFCRCNSGCLVNLERVHKIEAGSVTVGNRKISVSRGRKEHFMHALVEVMTVG